MSDSSAVEILSGDFVCLAHVLDCLYRSCVNLDAECFCMILVDLTQAGLLERDALASKEPEDVFKLIRGILYFTEEMRQAESAEARSMFLKTVAKIEEFLNSQTDVFTG